GGGDKTVAEVGGQQGTQQQLDALVQPFRREAQQGGEDFPEQGTAGFVQLRNQLLGLLVYRTELKQAAKRLGVTVSDTQVNERLAPAPARGENAGEPHQHNHTV